jgi:hypothetical protein
MRVYVISAAWMALGWMATELVAVALPPVEASRERPRQHLVPPANEGTMWSLAFPQPPAVGKAIASEVLPSA